MGQSFIILDFYIQAFKARSEADTGSSCRGCGFESQHPHGGPWPSTSGDLWTCAEHTCVYTPCALCTFCVSFVCYFLSDWFYLFIYFDGGGGGEVVWVGMLGVSGEVEEEEYVQTVLYEKIKRNLKKIKMQFVFSFILLFILFQTITPWP